MRMDAAGRVEFDRSFADAIPREARAAAELETLRRDYPGSRSSGACRRTAR
jgi:hypothetical protein